MKWLIIVEGIKRTYKIRCVFVYTFKEEWTEGGAEGVSSGLKGVLQL